jgi:F-type H+-transporting ATPase subunit delta
MAAGAQGATVARNYAETLLELAHRAGAPRDWAALMRQVADAVAGDTTLARFLESPRIAAADKIAVLERAFGARMPRLFLRFLQQLVRNRRQGLIPRIADEVETLLDASQGIVHARVTVARPTPDAERDAIAARLSAVVGKTVVPHLAVDPDILGGVVVRIGDTVMDGSVRRKLGLLRRRMAVGAR